MLDATHSPTSAATVTARVFVAVDPSRTSWAVALQTSSEGRTSTRKLQPGDIDRLLALIERTRAREEKQSGGPVEAHSC